MKAFGDDVETSIIFVLTQKVLNVPKDVFTSKNKH